jgi:hypothetical protein
MASRKLGDWLLGDELGRGAMGIVHHPTHPLMDGGVVLLEIFGKHCVQ